MARGLDKFDCIVKFEIDTNLPISSEKLNLNSQIHVNFIGKHYSNVAGYLYD